MNYHPQETTVSVIIPVYKDAERLSKCLDSLALQRYPKELFEIIIVNNDPECRIDIDIPDNAIILEEAKPGSYAARNEGIRNATGDVIAFTDSDCIPQVDWIKHGVSELQSVNSGGRVAGAIKIFRAETGGWLSWKFDQVSAFHQKHSSRHGKSVTANMFVRKELFSYVGLFNESIFSGGDIEWSERASRAGWTITYRPDALVLHPARNDFVDLIKKRRRIAGGSVNRRVGAFKRVMYILKLILPPVRPAKIWLNEGSKLWEIVLCFLILWFLKIIMSGEALLVFLGKEPLR